VEGKLETRFITHLIVDKIPDKGFQKLYFYTATAKGYNHGKYFWGTDNNELDEEYIKNLENLNKIIRLPIPKEIKKNKSLWVDNNGRVYYASTQGICPGPFQDRECLFAPQQLSRAYQIYKETIGGRPLPKLVYYYEIQ
jgi:hypothetical protein